MKELDVLTYFRKMKQIEIAQRVLFTRKERYLIDRQKEFVLDYSLSESISSDQQDEVASSAVALNSDDENGPIRSVQWWDELRREKKLISGLLNAKTTAGKTSAPVVSRATP